MNTLDLRYILYMTCKITRSIIIIIIIDHNRSHSAQLRRREHSTDRQRWRHDMHHEVFNVDFCESVGQSTNMLVTAVLIRHSWQDGNTQQTDRDEDMACIAKFLMLIFVKVLPASVANWDPSRMSKVVKFCILSKCQLTPLN